MTGLDRPTRRVCFYIRFFVDILIVQQFLVDDETLRVQVVGRRRGHMYVCVVGTMMGTGEM